MKRVTTSLSSIVLFCRNLERTTGFYTSVLGLKVTKQSEYLTELRDQRSNVLILRKSTGMEAVLTKGYSPILCFTVDNFESANEKLKQYDLPIDGEIIRSQELNMLTVRGPQGEMLCLTDLQEQPEESDQPQKVVDATEEQIKRILSKLKM